MSNKILLAMMATVKETCSFLSCEELLAARGQLVKEMPAPIADVMLEGVNIGLYYAYMFTLPEKQLVSEQKEKFDTMLNNEVTEWLKVAVDSRKLLGGDDD